MKRIIEKSLRKNYRVIKRSVKVILGKEIAFRPQIKTNKVFLGNEYGGYFICPDMINENSIVYSFGIGEDISFDNAVIDTFGCYVHAFDPTPRSIEWLKQQTLPENFKYYQYGIANENGTISFEPPSNPKYVSYSAVTNKTEESIDLPVYKLSTIMDMLGHRKIDILKMDIEGLEYSVLEGILKEKLDIHQICVEVHHRFEGIGISFTKNLVENLNLNGYKLISTHEGEAYSFIKVKG